MLTRRLAYGSALTVVVVLILWADWRYGLPELTCGVVALLIIAAQLEMVALLSEAGVELWRRTAIAAGWFLALTRTGLPTLVANRFGCFGLADAMTVAFTNNLDVLLVVAGCAVAAIFADDSRRAGTRRAAGTLAAALLLPLTVSFLARLRLGPDWVAWGTRDGFVAVVLVVAASKLGDVAAFFAGSFFGRHKMAPATSPNKTWEGAAAALAASTLCAALIGWVGGFRAAWSAGFGLLVGLAAQLGDLVESRIKRDAAAKDSARLIPAFGGVLDTLDSLILAAPAGFALHCLGIYLGGVG